MLIHLSDVLSETGKKCSYQVPVGFTSIEYAGMQTPIVKAKDASLTLVNKGSQKIDAFLQCEISLNLPCDRCMEDVKVLVSVDSEVEIDMNEPFSEELTQEEQDAELERLQEQPFIEGHELNTDELLLQEISFNLPEKVLCKEDCKGLCMKCGKNLNHGACSCEDEPKDIRMMQFLDVFNAANKKKN